MRLKEAADGLMEYLDDRTVEGDCPLCGSKDENGKHEEGCWCAILSAAIDLEAELESKEAPPCANCGGHFIHSHTHIFHGEDVCDDGSGNYTPKGKEEPQTCGGCGGTKLKSMVCLWETPDATLTGEARYQLCESCGWSSQKKKPEECGACGATSLQNMFDIESTKPTRVCTRCGWSARQRSGS